MKREYGSRDIGAEVDVTRRVDEVDEIGDLLCHLLRSGLVGDDRFVFEKERNGTGFHRDASFLLFLTT